MFASLLTFNSALIFYLFIRYLFLPLVYFWTTIIIIFAGYNYSVSSVSRLLAFSLYLYVCKYLVLFFYLEAASHFNSSSAVIFLSDTISSLMVVESGARFKELPYVGYEDGQLFDKYFILKLQDLCKNEVVIIVFGFLHKTISFPHFNIYFLRHPKYLPVTQGPQQTPAAYISIYNYPVTKKY